MLSNEPPSNIVYVSAAEALWARLAGYVLFNDFVLPVLALFWTIAKPCLAIFRFRGIRPTQHMGSEEPLGTQGTDRSATAITF